MLLTEEEIKKWNVPRERLNEKYYNSLMQQTLPYDEIVKITVINGDWETEWNFTSPVEEVEWRIQQGIYVLVEDEKGLSKKKWAAPIILNLQENSNLLKFKYEQRRKR